MTVQELENLRQKYPQYNGIDDMTLATKLAGKYPQYGFILDKVKAENPQGESGDDHTGGMSRVSALDYWIKNPAKSVVKAYVNDAKDIGNALTHPLDTAVGMVKSIPKNWGDVGNAIQGIPDMVMNHPIQTGLALAPGVEGAVGLAENTIKGTVNNAVKTGRYFSRIGSTFKPKAISNLNLSNSERIGNLATRAKGEAGTDIQPLQNKIKENQKSIQNTLGSVRESKMVLKKNMDGLKNDLQKAAEKGSVEFQKKLPDFFHANSEAYENARDNAFDQMDKQGKGITHQEVFSAIQKTKQDIKDALIPEDAPAIKIINQLEKKYNPKVSEEPGKIIGEDGKPISTNVKSKANDFVDLKVLVQDLRNVKSTLSASASTGRTGFSQEDLPVAYINHNLGDYIKNKIPAFASLQKEYSPVIQAMKEAHKIFKPNAGEFTPRSATGFLKKAGTGKLEEEGRNVLNALEKGNKFSPGVGDISSQVKVIGKSMDDVKTQIQKLDEQANKITGRSKIEIQNKQKIIDDRKLILQKRLETLEKRRQEVNRMQANKDVIGRLTKAIFHKTADATGLGITKSILR